MVFNSSVPGCHLLQLPWNRCPLVPLMTSNIWALVCYPGFFHPNLLYFLWLLLHRHICWVGASQVVWFVAYFNSYESMGSAMNLLGCNELHNACAIHCTNKKIFLRPRMPWEPDKRKELHLTEPPRRSMCLSWGTCPYSDGWWSVGSRPSNHPATLRHIYFCCYLVHFILVWFVFCSSQSGHFMSTLASGSNSCFL